MKLLHIQGIPRNMREKLRFERRLWSLYLFLAFSRQPSFKFKVRFLKQL